MNNNPTPNNDNTIETMTDVMKRAMVGIKARSGAELTDEERKKFEACEVDLTADYRQTIKGWYIDPNGNLVHRPTGYDIAAASLTQADWISHMRQKAWCDLAEFIPAYFLALEQSGVKQITIDLYGWRSGYKFDDDKDTATTEQ